MHSSKEKTRSHEPPPLQALETLWKTICFPHFPPWSVPWNAFFLQNIPEMQNRREYLFSKRISRNMWKGQDLVQPAIRTRSYNVYSLQLDRRRRSHDERTGMWAHTRITTSLLEYFLHSMRALNKTAGPSGRLVVEWVGTVRLVIYKRERASERERERGRHDCLLRTCIWLVIRNVDSPRQTRRSHRRNSSVALTWTVSLG